MGRSRITTEDDGDDEILPPSRVNDNENPIGKPNPSNQQESNLSDQGNLNVNEDSITHPAANGNQFTDAKANGLPENARDLSESNDIEEPLVKESLIEGNPETPGEDSEEEGGPAEQKDLAETEDGIETENLAEDNETSVDSKPNEEDGPTGAQPTDKSLPPREEVPTENQVENFVDSELDENEEDGPTEAQVTEESLPPGGEVPTANQGENLLDSKSDENKEDKNAETEATEETFKPQEEEEATTEPMAENNEPSEDSSAPAETHEEATQESGKLVEYSENQDEIPSDPSAGTMDVEGEVDKAVEEATDGAGESVHSLDDDSIVVDGDDIPIEQQPQEDEKEQDEDKKGSVESEEQSSSDPVEEDPGAVDGDSEANANEATQEEDVPAEGTVTADGGDANTPPIPHEAPSRATPSEEVLAKLDSVPSPAASVKARPKADLTGLTSDTTSSPPQQENEEDKALYGAKSATSVAASSTSSEKTRRSRPYNTGNPRAPRPPRKKGGSRAGGSEEQTVGDETEGTKRPKFSGNLQHSLHKPDHLRNRRSGEEEGADADGEQNLIPIPGAFAFSGAPSEEDVVVNPTDRCDQASQSEESQLTGAETITTAVLARELNEEELEANRLENEHLRREVSQMRRERDNVAVVTAVHADVDDGQKTNSDEGMSLTCKLGIVVVVLALIGGGAAAYFLLGKDNNEPIVPPKSDLPCVSESEIFPLGLCVGDCDNDGDCESGLVCFQRDSFEAVPGCSCAEDNDSRTDYCVEKELPPLVLIDDTNRDNFPLGLCYGDCDDDNDCEEGLICFQREAEVDVPQCAGGASDKSKSDYCIKGDEIKVPEDPQALGECGGPCNEDFDCERGLFCYPRREGAIPGCPGIDWGASTDRYCVKVVYQDPEVTETNVFPLGLCEGDCDNDIDCQDGLFCYQREPFQGVQGCTGGGEDESATDYCAKEMYRDSTPLFNWGDPLSGLSGEHFGSSVSLSEDGQILVVGAKDAESVGVVTVYKATKTDSIGIPESTSFSSPLASSVLWDEVGSIKGDDSVKEFGSKSALSSDGRTLVVGGFKVSTNGRVAACIRVFQATDTVNGIDFSNWTSVDAVSWETGTRAAFEMIGDYFEEGDNFDFSVSISSDGKFVALGQPSNGGEKIVEIHRGPLLFQMDKENGIDVMTFLGCPFQRFFQGPRVAISTSSAGNPRVAAGGDNSARGLGQVRVMELFKENPPKLPEFENEYLGWFEVALSIGPSDGTMVDLSFDGNHMALSITNRTSTFSLNDYGIEEEAVSRDGDEHVIVYQFKRQGIDDFWDQVGNLIRVESTSISHIPTVALSDDGKVLAVGEPWVNANTGRVRVFKYDRRSNRWQPLQQPIKGQTQGGLFGSSLSLVGGLSSSAGMSSATLAVGGPFSGSSQVGRGFVMCFRVTGDSVLMESSSSSLMESSQSQTVTSNLRGASSSRIEEIEMDLYWST